MIEIGKYYLAKNGLDVKFHIKIVSSTSLCFIIDFIGLDYQTQSCVKNYKIVNTALDIINEITYYEYIESMCDDEIEKIIYNRKKKIEKLLSV